MAVTDPSNNFMDHLDILVLGCCCPCVLYGHMCERLNSSDNPVTIDGSVPFVQGCVGMFCCGMCLPSFYHDQIMAATLGSPPIGCPVACAIHLIVGPVLLCWEAIAVENAIAAATQ